MWLQRKYSQMHYWQRKPLKKTNKIDYPLEGLRQEQFKFSEICFGVLP